MSELGHVSAATIPSGVRVTGDINNALGHACHSSGSPSPFQSPTGWTSPSYRPSWTYAESNGSTSPESGSDIVKSPHSSSPFAQPYELTMSSFEPFPSRSPAT